MIEFIGIGVIAALYVLGSYQGSTIADVVEDSLDPEEEVLTAAGRAYLTWAWPIATISAMMHRGDEQ